MAIERPGQTSVTLVGDHSVEIRFGGWADGALVERATELAREALGGRSVRFVLFDLAGVTGFGPSVAAPGNALLRELREERGVELALAFGASAPVRMMGQSIAFAARLPLRFAETRAAALAEVDRRISVRSA